jgi:glyoxylase-like metal-dependent hydrolase (beta-lactamase superfamily II)
MMIHHTNRIQYVFAAVIVACGLLSRATTALAEAPMVKTQSPGFYRMMLGRIEVTALLDGFTELNASLLRNVSETEIRDLLKHAFIDDPQKLPTSVNAYLVNAGGKLALVDAGGAGLGPKFGRLLQNLKAAGYGPEQVDYVLLTHLHPDHAAGLLNSEGKPAFPNATALVAKAESEYWLSTADPDKAPPEYREHLKSAVKLVRRAADPYIHSERWKTFEGSELPIAGMRAIAIPGHTPGHMAYEIHSDGRTLVILGDMVHCGAVQFARPGAAVSFDSDPKQAVASREALFRRIADGKTLVAGMHLSFPGIGRIRMDGENAYTWVPIEYGPVEK